MERILDNAAVHSKLCSLTSFEYQVLKIKLLIIYVAANESCFSLHIKQQQERQHSFSPIHDFCQIQR